MGPSSVTRNTTEAELRSRLVQEFWTDYGKNQNPQIAANPSKIGWTLLAHPVTGN